MDHLMQIVRTFASDDEGSQVIEYALIIAVVSITLVVALRNLTGADFAGFIARVGTCLTSATPASEGTKQESADTAAFLTRQVSDHAARTTNRRRQGGAVIITMALLLLFLLGFMGFALDFGRLFIVKTELQTAMDSCALSAAQELDGQANAITRARSAGMTAANLNRVNLQSATWDGKGQFTRCRASASATRATHRRPATLAADYAECQHAQPDVRMWLMHAMARLLRRHARFPRHAERGAPGRGHARQRPDAPAPSRSR